MSSKPSNPLLDTVTMSSKPSFLLEVLEEPPADFTVDKALSSELMGLSTLARIAIEEEIHGVRSESTYKKESPQILWRSLREFDQVLNARKEAAEDDLQGEDFCIHALNGLLLRNVIRTHCYDNDNSNSKKHCYLNDPKVRLRFLRCECFVVKPAVDRFIEFLELTQELFGGFVADRPIKLSDFSKGEACYLRNSRSQYLPFRDRSGRRVMATVGFCNFDIPVVIQCKILLFMHWVVSEDVETQRKGIVMLSWPFDESNKDNRTWENTVRPGLRKEIPYYMHKHNISMPVRIASNQHYFKNTPFFKTLSALYVFHALKKHDRSIYRAYFGDEIEIRNQIANYGIAEILLPMSTTSKVKTDQQFCWIRMLHKKSEWSGDAEFELVECPRSDDIVFKRGRPLYVRNPGNMYYQELIATTSEEHDEADRAEKFELTKKIVEQLETKGGRFLEWVKDRETWLVLTDRKFIREKIAAAYKQYNRNYKAYPPNAKRHQYYEPNKQPVATIATATEVFVEDPATSGERDDPPCSTPGTNPGLPQVPNTSTIAAAAPSRQPQNASSEGRNSTRPYDALTSEHCASDVSSKRPKIPVCSNQGNASNTDHSEVGPPPVDPQPEDDSIYDFYGKGFIPIESLED